MKTLRNEVKVIKTNSIDKQISTPNHHQTTLVASFYIIVEFDKSFHPVVLYENYLICIFLTINENLKHEGENHWINLYLGGNKTYIEHLGHFLMDINLFNGTT